RPRAMRYLFIGDIHGCIEELRDLLDLAALGADDLVVSLGDIVRKGPDALACARLIRERGGRAVLGNNEDKLLRNPFRRIVQNRELMRYVSKLPYVLDFPAIGVRAVHGGVLPDGRLNRKIATTLRWLKRGKRGWEPSGQKQKPGEVFWAEVWDGDRLVVYGHTPRKEPRIDRKAIGVDTGCVYGGKLTGVLFHGPGEWQLLQVPARRKYSD
ncbi:MAG TPA: metallophosphoesterase, partial [Thermoanaerobaculia bacterium]|nr:metallophosphoesterase [Thermoanaerobaculia bacterium]